MDKEPRKRIQIVVKRDEGKTAKVFSPEPFPSSFTIYSTPLPFASKSSLCCSPTKDINPNKTFGRSGLIPFLNTDEGVVILLNVFKGKDRGIPVQELSDFSGRVEKSENFITSACWETLEESLSLLNFIGRESTIAKDSYSSYSEDGSLITTAVAIEYPDDILNLLLDFNHIKEDINGPIEEDHELPPRINKCRSILFEDREVVKPVLCRKEEQVEEKLSLRAGMFNSNECRHIVYISVKDVEKMLIGEKCPIPSKLNLAVKSNYNFYPDIYFAIDKHLSNLLPYIEHYFDK